MKHATKSVGYPLRLGRLYPHRQCLLRYIFLTLFTGFIGVVVPYCCNSDMKDATIILIVLKSTPLGQRMVTRGYS